MVRARPCCFASLVACAVVVGVPASAQETPDVVIDEPVPDDGAAFFLVPFTVADGVDEIEVRHSVVDGSDDDVLDFGLEDASGAFRGWGGGNSEPAVVGVRAASRSYVPGPLPAGTWHVVVGKARLSSDAPRYRVEVFVRATATLPDDGDQQQVAATTSSDEARWYAGDLHVHSHNTNAQVAHLDEAQARHPDLLFVPGVEFTTYGGHAGGFGVTDYVDHKVGMSTTVQDAVDRIHAQGALFSINHPTLDLGDVCIGCAWTNEIPGAVDGVEIETGGYRQSGFIFGAGARDFWDRLLDDGSHAAPLGGSDDHRAGVDLEAFGSPIGDPTTMIFAEGQSTNALLDGIRCNRTVVKLQGPDDPMIDLQTIPERFCDTVVATEVVLRATITGGVGLRVRFLKDGYVDGDAHDIDADPFVVERRLPEHADDERWRVEVTDGETPRVVTGHVWLETLRTDTEIGPCGCHGAGDAAVPVCSVLMLLARRRRKPRTPR